MTRHSCPSLPCPICARPLIEKALAEAGREPATFLPVPSDAELATIRGPDYAKRDARAYAAVLAGATSDLPPSSPILLLAFDLAAALDADDSKRAYESACALNELVGQHLELLSVDHDNWREAALAARLRVGLEVA